MERFAYTTVDRVLASLQRSTGEEDVPEETLVEWIGEALGYLYRKGSLKECLMIAMVENYTVTMPEHFKYISGILKNRNYDGGNTQGLITTKEVGEQLGNICTSCNSENENCVCIEPQMYCYLGLGSADRETFLRKDLKHTLFGVPVPFISLNWDVGYWYSSHMCRNNFERVTLSDSRFFKSQVLKDEFGLQPQAFGDHKYTLAGQNIKFSFQRGQVAISYLKVPVDPETGYPMIPDDSAYINALTYFLRWKLAEFYDWTGREGFVNKIQSNFALWEKYAAQARVRTIKTRTRDEADRLNESHNTGYFDTNRYM